MAFKTKHDEFEGIQWSDEAMTIRDVVNKGLPEVVKIAEGYCGDNEAESFSRGDLLKLDFVKTIQKVSATIVPTRKTSVSKEKTKYNQSDKEIVIPLGYKGKVLIHGPSSVNKVYSTVEELLTDFPRFVLVEKPFFARTNTDQAIIIEAGGKLELDRYLPAKGLVAHYKTKTVVLNKSVSSKFVPLPDKTEYTLSEIIERLPLPQFVKFVDEEFQRVLTTDLIEAVENVKLYTGIVKLERVFTEDVVVGHHKPQGTECMKNKHGKYVERGILLLPFERAVVGEIEVNIPIYSEPSEYDILVARNFTENTPSMDVIDGCLYVEFSKNPKSIYVLGDKKGNDTLDIEDAPPIPPRRGRPTKAKSVDLSTTMSRHSDLDPEDDYEEVNPPPIIPRTKSQIIQRSLSLDNQKPTDGEYQSITVPKTFFSTLKRQVHTKIFEKLNTKSSLPKQENSPTVEMIQPLPMSKYDAQRTKSSSPMKPSETKHQHTNNQNECDDDETSGDYQYLDVTKMMLLPLPQAQQPKPIVRVQHNARIPTTTNTVNLSQMSVTDLVQCLNQCALQKLALLCEEHAINGRLLSELTDETLRKEPFCLKDIELTKVQKMKEGWRPKIN